MQGKPRKRATTELDSRAPLLNAHSSHAEYSKYIYTYTCAHAHTLCCVLYRLFYYLYRLYIEFLLKD